MSDLREKLERLKRAHQDQQALYAEQEQRSTEQVQRDRREVWDAVCEHLPDLAELMKTDPMFQNLNAVEVKTPDGRLLSYRKPGTDRLW